MGALCILDRGILASEFLASYTDKRPKIMSEIRQKIGGVTLPVTCGVMLRVDEEKNNTIYVEPGQEIHFFQNPDKAISRGTIVFAVYQGKASVAVYRMGVGIKQKC